MNENKILPTILAGGKSSRFGSDKSMAILGDKKILDYTVDKIEKNFSEILIVTNNNKLLINNKKISIVKDCLPGQLGPLVGVLTAFQWIKKNKKKYNWVATFPCDSPFFDDIIFDHLKEKSKDEINKIFFFKTGEKRHNIFGLLSTKLEHNLENDLKKNHRKVETWANKIGIKEVKIDEEKNESFLNINTIEDYEKAKKKIKQK